MRIFFIVFLLVSLNKFKLKIKTTNVKQLNLIFNLRLNWKKIRIENEITNQIVGPVQRNESIVNKQIPAMAPIKS